AIPPGKTSPLELATWPLRFAALVCSYLQSRHQVFASLKWPNDIYVDGEKLGGVLGESVMQGAGVHAIVIGLGLNVDHTPDEPLEADATSLGVHGVAAASAETICEELVAMFDARWPDFRDMPLATLWDAYGLPAGQIWGETGDQPVPQLVATAYSTEGGLSLQELGSGKDVQF